MRRWLVRAWIAVAIACCILSVAPAARQLPAFGGDVEYLTDLRARRAATRAALRPGDLLVLWSAPERVYSGDIEYRYRQESNLLYLTGLSQPDSILVLVPGARTRREFLFTRSSTPQQELWFGHLLTPAEARRSTGVDDVYSQRQHEVLDQFLAGLLSGRLPAMFGADAAEEFAAVTAAMRNGSGRIGILDSLDDRPGEPQTDISRVAWAKDLARQFPGVGVFSAGELLQRQRQIKTAYEQVVLTRSVAISAQAHVEGMRATKVGRWEYEVQAAIERVYLSNGALSWGYPSIVASGPNATTLHYLSSTRQMRPGDLLLVDAAANFQGLTGDITRTYPVSGRFTADQRRIYDLVLRAQQAGIMAARPGRSIEDVTRAVRAVFAAGLQELGLIEDGARGPDSEQLNLWFPHAPVHGIGTDVHDPLGPLEPGAAFVIEPGLYFRSDAFERLGPSADNQVLADRLAPTVRKYLDIGVRIEDSFLMTPSGPLNLSVAAPKVPRDLERIVGRGR